MLLGIPHIIPCTLSGTKLHIWQRSCHRVIVRLISLPTGTLQTTPHELNDARLRIRQAPCRRCSAHNAPICCAALHLQEPPLTSAKQSEMPRAGISNWSPALLLRKSEKCHAEDDHDLIIAARPKNRTRATSCQLSRGQTIRLPTLDIGWGRVTRRSNIQFQKGQSGNPLGAKLSSAQSCRISRDY